MVCRVPRMYQPRTMLRSFSYAVRMDCAVRSRPRTRMPRSAAVASWACTAKTRRTTASADVSRVPPARACAWARNRRTHSWSSIGLRLSVRAVRRRSRRGCRRVRRARTVSASDQWPDRTSTLRRDRAGSRMGELGEEGAVEGLVGGSGSRAGRAPVRRPARSRRPVRPGPRRHRSTAGPAPRRRLGVRRHPGRRVAVRPDDDGAPEDLDDPPVDLDVQAVALEGLRLRRFPLRPPSGRRARPPR